MAGVVPAFISAAALIAVCVWHGLAVSMFLYHDIGWSDLPRPLLCAFQTSAVVMLVIRRRQLSRVAAASRRYVICRREAGQRGHRRDHTRADPADVGDGRGGVLDHLLAGNDTMVAGIAQLITSGASLPDTNECKGA